MEQLSRKNMAEVVLVKLVILFFKRKLPELVALPQHLLVLISQSVQMLFLSVAQKNLKMKYLPALTSGEKIAAFALTEAETGSDTFNLQTRAEFKADKCILSGSKVWTTNAGIADVFSVFARTEKGITGFVVEKDFPGIFIGPKEKNLG